MRGKKSKTFGLLVCAIFLIVTATQPIFAFGLSETKSGNTAKGSSVEAKYSQDRIIVTFKDDITKKEAASILEKEKMKLLFSSSAKGGITSVDLPNNLPVEKALQIMNEKEEVAAVQPDYFYEYDGYTNDIEISSNKYSSNKNKYHYIFQLGLAGPGKTAWNYATGKGVNVAVIDCGANVNHLDLAANVKGCYNAVTDTEGKSAVTPVNGHGTATSGILAAVGNNKRLSAGVAYNANLYVINAEKELEDGSYGMYTTDIIKGVTWAREKKCRVISISASGESENQAMRDIIWESYTQSKNSIVFVASGGNSGKEEYRYSASSDGVLAVSALNYSNGKYTISPNSTYNDKIDLAAPGSKIYTLSHKDNTSAVTAGATSAATPYVAGVAALVLQANPSLTAQECAQILTSTATDAGTKGYDKRYGYGIINPLKAVQKAVYKTNSKAQKITGVSSSYKKTYTASAFMLNPKLTGSGVASFKSSNSNVASVNSSGKVTPKQIGTTTISISVPASGIFTSASKKAVLTVTPINGKIRSAKNIKGKKLRLKWNRDKKASGYQIKLSRNKNFKKAKTYWIKKNKTTAKTISRLKKGKRYYVKIRAYKKVNGKKIYGSYSKAKSVKIKR